MTMLWDSVATASRSVRSRVHREAVAYRGGRDRPLAAYAGAMAVYAGGVTALSLVARSSGRTTPPLSVADVVLLALATNRLTRIVSREPIASPLRAPFTRFTGGTKGPAQLAEEARGEGAREVVGELVTCPFCLSQWVATGLGAAMVFAPSAGRFGVQVLASLGVADFLQFAWAKADQATH
jgi:hypothetical protein